MRSLNRHVTNERVALVVDTAVGSNADSKGLKSHIAALRKGTDEDLPGSGVEGLDAFVKEARQAGLKKVKRG